MIRPMDEIGVLDSSQKIDTNELSLGKTLVENLTTEEFDLGDTQMHTQKNLRN